MSRFLVVSQDFLPDVGGTQTYAWEIACRFAEHHEVVVVAPSRPGCAATDHEAPFAVRRVPGGLNGFIAGAVPAVSGLLGANDVAGALCIQWTASVAVQTAAALSRTRVPLGLAVHGRELLFSPFRQGAPSVLYDDVRRKGLLGADRVFAVSRYTAGLARNAGVPDSRLVVVPNGVNVKRFNPTLRSPARARLGLVSERMILTVCRLVGRKGVDVLLEAAARICRDNGDVRFWIAGDGPDRAALIERADALGLGDRVRFLGRVEPDLLPDLFAAADVFAMVPRHTPPDVEGFGLVYLEASACGVPALGSRAGGIEDAVLDGETGLLVESGDADATAMALSRLLDDSTLARRLGSTGRKHAERVATWDRVASSIRRELLGDIAD